MIQIRSKRIIDEYHGFSFSRSSMARDQKGKLYYPNNARFLPGKFGQAVLVEEGTTNLITKDFDTWNNNGYYLELTKNDDWDYTIRRKSGDNAFLSIDIPCTPNTTYCFSVEQLINSDMKQIVIFHRGIQSGIQTSSKSIKSPGKYSLIFTTAENDTQLRLYIHCGSSGEAGQQARIRLPQLEQKPYSTSFIDGTRAAETLTIPTAGVFNKGDWTLELWYKAKKFGSMPRALVELWIDDGNKYAIELDSSYKLTGGIKYNGSWTWLADSSIVTDDIWYYIAFTGNGNTIKFYVNGELKGSSVYSEPVGNLPSYIYLGSNPSGVNQPNSLIDDLRISNRARTDEEIAAAYASGQPLPVDQYTTCKLSFDGPDGQRGTTIVTL